MTTPEQQKLHDALNAIGPWKGVKQIVASFSDHELLTEPVDAAQPQGDLINHGGRTIGTEGRVVLVYVDQFSFNETQFTQFMTNIVEGGYFKDPTGEQSDCTFVGSAHINPSGLSGQVDDSAIQTFIQNHLGHEIPAADGNTYYCLILPTGVSAAFTGQNAACCSAFCGYHSNFQVNGNGAMVYYGIICDPNCTGCSVPTEGYPPYGALTAVSSHEYIEWRSDPEGSAWYDAQGNENADKCAWLQPPIKWGPNNDVVNAGWQNGKAAGQGCATGFGVYHAPPSPSTPLAATLSNSPTQIQPGASVAFVADVTGGTQPYTASVDFGDGSGAQPVTAASFSHVYTNPGTFTPIITVSDEAGAKVTATGQLVTVAAAPQPASIAFVGSPYSGIAGQPISMATTAKNVPAGAQVVWNFGDGTPAVMGPGGTQTHVYEAAGTDSVTAVLQDANGNLLASASTTAQVTAAPVTGAFTPSPDKPLGAILLAWLADPALCQQEAEELFVMCQWLQFHPGDLQLMLNAGPPPDGYNWGPKFVQLGWIDSA